jgi:hypothetical protein
MFSKMQKIILSSLVGAIGLGIAGIIFGYLQTMEDNAWLWILGWLGIGIISSATLGFTLGGRKKVGSFTVWGAIAGVVSGFLTGGSEYELWLQMAIIGLVFGVAMGIACASFTPAVTKKSDDRNIHCDECKAMVSKNDKYCPNCGTEFE